MQARCTWHRSSCVQARGSWHRSSCVQARCSWHRSSCVQARCNWHRSSCVQARGSWHRSSCVQVSAQGHWWPQRLHHCICLVLDCRLNRRVLACLQSRHFLSQLTGLRTRCLELLDNPPELSPDFVLHCLIGTSTSKTRLGYFLTIIHILKNRLLVYLG